MAPSSEGNGDCARSPGGWRAALLLSLLLPGCSTAQTLSCVAGEAAALDRELEETSGAAWPRQDPDVYWTVNDGRGGRLYAVDLQGNTVAEVKTEGHRLWDVEAMAAGPCGEAWCLYMADTGDNDERRDVVSVYRLPEPDFQAEEVERIRYPFTFPDGPQDVEALFVLPGERVYLVSKGRSQAPTLYRYPGALREDSTVVLEKLNGIGSGPATFRGRITGASDVPGHDDLALIRSYESLRLFRITDAGLEALPGGELTLVSLGEPQGEAVAMDPQGQVVLTTEAGPLAERAGMRVLRCSVELTPEG